MSAMFSSFSDTVSDKIGDLNALATTDKSSVVGAINEIVNGNLENLIFVTKQTINPEDTAVHYVYVNKPKEGNFSCLLVQPESRVGNADEHLDVWVQAVNVSSTQSLIRYKAPTANSNYPITLVFIGYSAS